MTEPLVPSDIDVDRLAGFLLDVDRLLSSELVAISSGDEFKAAVLLWCRAWKQKPAGSLPNDEKVLAAFSGAGKGWPKVRDVALRGWVLCSDGRLYHRVLCEDVLRAAKAKKARHDRTAAATAAREAKRDEQRNVERDEPQGEQRDVDVATTHRRDGTERRKEKEIEGLVSSLAAHARGASPRTRPLSRDEKRAAWAQNVMGYLNRTLPTARAEEIVAGFLEEQEWAIDEFNRASDRMKAEKSRVSA